jgi:hypothetical protein
MAVRLSALRASRPLPPGRFLVLFEAEATPGLDQFKNLMTSSGIEPAIFRLVAECLNELRYRVLLFSVLHFLISDGQRLADRLVAYDTARPS